MHRRSVQCFADISSRAASSSKRVVVPDSLSQCRHASTQALGKGKFTAISSSQLKDVAKLLVKQEKPKGKDTKKKGAATKKPQVVVDSAGAKRLDSGGVNKLRSDIFLPEKSEFLSPRQDDPWQADIELSGEESAGKYDISRGTFLEVRRNNITVHSIAVEVVPYGGRWMIMALTSTGEVWPCREDDVQFRIPGFADKNIVMKVGTDAYSEDPDSVAARIKLAKQMRDFDKQVEVRLSQLSPALRDIYDHFKAPDSAQWSSVTLSEVAKFVDPKSDPPHISSLLAIQNYLFSKSIYFVPDPSNFLETQKFYLRPVTQIEDAQFVNELVLRRDHRLSDFAAKATEQIRETRKLHEESWSEPPTIQPSTVSNFTPDEARILRFLDSTVRAVRAVQADPFLTQQAAVLKKIDVYDDEISNDLTQRFMTDCGLLAPWEEQIAREHFEGPESSSRAQKREAGADSIVTLAATTSQPLGPQDFYSHDPVESLRCDFGNMPVYVIDDYGAEELDDGVSVERIPSEPESTWIHVHIADPTAMVPPTSDIAKAAFEKGQTAYLLDRTISMLPHGEPFNQLSLGARSSQTGQPEPAMTFSIKIDAHGDIVDTKVQPSVIKNIHRLKYSDVDVALGIPRYTPQHPFGDDQPQPAAQPVEKSAVGDLTLLQKVTQLMVKKRFDAGIMWHTVPKAAVKINPAPLPTVPRNFGLLHECRGFPEISYTVEDFVEMEKGSRNMVAETMKLACRAASRFFTERGLPGIRRTQGPAFYGNEETHANLLAMRSEHGVVHWVESIRAGVVAPSARYTLKPEGHFLLGIPEGEGYMKVTSPLRRFQDMIAHWQIKHALLHPDKPALFANDWLQRMAKDTEALETGMKRIQWQQTLWYALKRIERARVDRQKGVQFARYPLDDLKGVIFQVPVKNATTNALQSVVYIPALGLKAFLVNLAVDQDLQIGDEVPIELGDIRFGLRPRVDATIRK
ncbi:hypothetical protein CERSUDRAFT_145337 [Gelatoporia subvermispora B]|uniref:RNB domain-containing protein n=1 Tax=Ceriporiopsis subvermispora (strain B) TaxID=914234 RepID=M2QXS9_CERS8|nr:hypothetical protein CERSUDRAFT_145337 [Gelatoporia subvermispora B]